MWVWVCVALLFTLGLFVTFRHERRSGNYELQRRFARSRVDKWKYSARLIQIGGVFGMLALIVKNKGFKDLAQSLGLMVPLLVFVYFGVLRPRKRRAFVSYLTAANNRVCPSCLYGLERIADGVCPECGTEFTQHTLDVSWSFLENRCSFIRRRGEPSQHSAA